MTRFLVGTSSATSVLLGLSFAFALPSLVLAASADDAADAAAVAAIEELGGRVRRLAVNTEDREVDFHLGGQALTDEGLAHVAQLDNVARLHLKGTKITDAGLAHLKGLTGLRRLHLETTAVGDAGIENLKGLTELEYLNLYGTNVTDASLEHLAGLKKLRRLCLWQTGVTDEGVVRLEKALPDVRITRGADLKVVALPPRKPPVPLKWVAASAGIPERSPSGENTFVTFENKSGRRVKIYWIGYDGQHKLYGELDADGTRQQNTYSEAVWLITDENDKPLGHFAAVRDDGRAVIPK